MWKGGLGWEARLEGGHQLTRVRPTKGGIRLKIPSKIHKRERGITSQPKLIKKKVGGSLRTCYWGVWVVHRCDQPEMARKKHGIGEVKRKVGTSKGNSRAARGK